MTPSIINKIPPVYHRYRAAFGPSVSWDGGVIIAYDGAIYTKAILTIDEIEHEKVHLMQQNEIGLTQWVDKYIADKRFRLDQEIPAYVRQAEVIRSCGLYKRKAIVERIKKMAKNLSSPMYGSIITFPDALNLLK